MKKIALLLLLLSLSGCTGYATKEGPYKVTKVIDGDTLDVGLQRIRLSGINTPEVGECYYKEAKDRLTEMALGKEVYLEKDRTDIDKYGRELRYIYLNGTLVNAVLVEEGYAKVFDKYKNDTKMYEQLKAIEKPVKENNRGVWACTDAKQECKYVASKNSKTYYKPDCKWARKIKPENIICFKSKEEIPKGHNPSKSCPT